MYNNMRNRSYPIEVQDIIKKNNKYKDKIKPINNTDTLGGKI